MFDFLDGFDIDDWFNWMVIGSFADELAEDERDRRRLEDDLDHEDDDEPW
jgi:hypothetical protein